jgi:predicted ATPase
MIQSVRFKNFKVLRDTTLPLGRCTLIVGPNGCGKSTALQALRAAGGQMLFNFYQVVTADLRSVPDTFVHLEVRFGHPINDVLCKTWVSELTTDLGEHTDILRLAEAENEVKSQSQRAMRRVLARTQIFAFDPTALAEEVRLQPTSELQANGANLAGVLDQLRDHNVEKFEALNRELAHWLPEFDRIVFETPRDGMRAFLLRTKKGQHRIAASDLSQGTLLALALLTLAYLPNPPAIVGLEEPDRGIHPRLLRDVQDALYRLSYPENYGEDRPPVQVIATTHSPYLLDLYRDTPEEVVIASKTAEGAQFERLAEQPYIEEVLRDTRLGEAWYTGVLGGVPAQL